MVDVDRRSSHSHGGNRGSETPRAPSKYTRSVNLPQTELPFQQFSTKVTKRHNFKPIPYTPVTWQDYASNASANASKCRRFQNRGAFPNDRLRDRYRPFYGALEKVARGLFSSLKVSDEVRSMCARIPSKPKRASLSPYQCQQHDMHFGGIEYTVFQQNRRTATTLMHFVTGA